MASAAKVLADAIAATPIATAAINDFDLFMICVLSQWVVEPQLQI
jgi:hypothetical protein